jgi:hypothetical protein
MLIPNKPEVELPKKFTEINLESLRVTGVEDIVANLWLQIKMKTEVSKIKNELSSKFSLSLPSIERLVSGRSSLPLDFIKEIIEKWKDICRPTEEKYNTILRLIEENSKFKGESNSTPVTLPQVLNPKLSYLIGALRDGSLPEVYNNQYEVQFSQQNKEWLEKVIVPTIKEVFGITTRVESYRNQTARVKIYSKPIYLFIKKFFEYPERLQVTWEVPKIIRSSPPEIKKWFIRGFFDSEGEINVRQKRVVIHHSWNGRKPVVLEQLHEILSNEFGIRSKVSKPHKEKNFPSFDLIITKENVWSFYQKIGTCHPEKILKFQLWRSSS